MMNPRYCSFCGHDKPPFHEHHLAGKRNHPHWTTFACIDCHIIQTAWQYADRVLVTGTDTREPLNKDQEQRIIDLALTRTAELIAASLDLIEYMLLFAMLAEMGKVDGQLPISKYRNPAPMPNPVPMHALERVAAAQIAIFAYILEEWLGYDHPLPVLLRRIELQPLAWTFDNTPGLATFDFSSGETVHRSIMDKAIAGFNAWTDDYMRRWKHR